jgi:16S rRNA (cytosine1402-N4)-methyltransferase
MAEGISFSHYSVMLKECIESLCIKPDGIYVDGTAGGGGHSFEIAKHLTTGRLIAIDQDADAIAAAGERLSVYGDRVTLVRDNFSNLANVCKNLEIEKIDGLLLDLGVSS